MGLGFALTTYMIKRLHIQFTGDASNAVKAAKQLETSMVTMQARTAQQGTAIIAGEISKLQNRLVQQQVVASNTIGAAHTQAIQRVRATSDQISTLQRQKLSVMKQESQDAVELVARQAEARMMALQSASVAAGQAVGVLFLSVAAALGYVGVKAILVSAQMEQVNIAFTTMLKSGAAANNMIQKLWEFAAHTPFQFQDVVKYSRMLEAMGFRAKELIPIFTGIGDAVAGLGGGPDMLERVVMAIGQIKTKGKVMAEELTRQLAQAGIPAWKYLAQFYNKSIQEVQEMSRKGQIRAEEGIKAIIAGMERDFGGMMEKQSHTIIGLWTNIHDRVIGILWAIGDTIVKAFRIKQLFQWIYDGLKKVTDLIQSKGLSVALQQIFSTKTLGLILAIAGALGGILVNAIIILGSRLGGLSVMMGVLFNKWTLIGTVIGVAAWLIIRNWDKVGPFFERIAATIGATIQALMQLPIWAKIAIAALGGLTIASKISAAISTLSLAIRALDVSFALLALKIIAIIAIVTVLIGIFYEWTHGIGSFRKKIDEMAKSMGDFGKQFTGTMKDQNGAAQENADVFQETQEAKEKSFKDFQGVFEAGSQEEQATAEKTKEVQIKSLSDYMNVFDSASKEEADTFKETQAKKIVALSDFMTIFDKTPQVIASNLNAVMRTMEANLRFFNTFQNNIAAISRRGAGSLAKYILEMGPVQGATYAAAFAKAKDSVLIEANKLTQALTKEQEKQAEENRQRSEKTVKNSKQVTLASAMSNMRANAKIQEEFDRNIAAIRARGASTLAEYIMSLGPIQGRAYAKMFATAKAQTLREGESLARALTKQQEKQQAEAQKQQEKAAKKTQEITLNTIMQNMRNNIKALREWHKNIAILQQRGAPTLASQVEEMGPIKGGAVALQLVKANPQQLKEAEEMAKELTGVETDEERKRREAHEKTVKDKKKRDDDAYRNALYNEEGVNKKKRNELTKTTSLENSKIKERNGLNAQIADNDEKIDAARQRGDYATVQRLDTINRKLKDRRDLINAEIKVLDEKRKKEQHELDIEAQGGYSKYVKDQAQQRERMHAVSEAGVIAQRQDEIARIDREISRFTKLRDDARKRGDKEGANRYQAEINGLVELKAKKTIELKEEEAIQRERDRIHKKNIEQQQKEISGERKKREEIKKTEDTSTRTGRNIRRWVAQRVDETSGGFFSIDPVKTKKRRDAELNRLFGGGLSIKLGSLGLKIGSFHILDPEKVKKNRDKEIKRLFDLYQTGKNIIAGLWKGISDAFLNNPIVKWVNQHIIDPVKTALGIKGKSKSSSVMLGIGDNIVGSLKGGILGAAKRVWDSASHIAWGIVQRIKDFLGIKGSSTVMHSIGDNIVGSLKGGLLDAAVRAWDAASHFAWGVVSRIRGQFGITGKAATVLREIGNILVGSIKGGLLDNAKRAWDAATHFAQTMINRVKEIFGIHSPSTVFRNIGANLVGGFIKGLSVGNLQDSVQTIFGGLPQFAASLLTRGFTLPDGVMDWLQQQFGYMIGGGGGFLSAPDWIKPLIEKAAATYHVSKDLIAAIIKAESGFNPRAKSGAGAQGLMQLMPGTARSLGVKDPFNPLQNIMGGTKYIKQLLDMFKGKVELAVAAYNAGPGAVKRYGGVPPYKETEAYVKKVLSFMQAIAGGSGAIPGSIKGLVPFVANLANLAVKFFGGAISSGFRPGAITSSGRTSLHASGRAFDYAGSQPQMWAVYQWAKHLPHVYEIIHNHSIWKKGKESYWRLLDHFNHTHVGFAHSGGVIAGGPNSAIVVNPGEVVFTNPQFARLTNIMDDISRYIKASNVSRNKAYPDVLPGYLNGTYGSLNERMEVRDEMSQYIISRADKWIELLKNKYSTSSLVPDIAVTDELLQAYQKKVGYYAKYIRQKELDIAKMRTGIWTNTQEHEYRELEKSIKTNERKLQIMRNSAAQSRIKNQIQTNVVLRAISQKEYSLQVKAGGIQAKQVEKVERVITTSKDKHVRNRIAVINKEIAKENQIIANGNKIQRAEAQRQKKALLDEAKRLGARADTIRYYARQEQLVNQLSIKQFEANVLKQKNRIAELKNLRDTAHNIKELHDATLSLMDLKLAQQEAAKAIKEVQDRLWSFKWEEITKRVESTANATSHLIARLDLIHDPIIKLQMTTQQLSTIFMGMRDGMIGIGVEAGALGRRLNKAVAEGADWTIRQGIISDIKGLKESGLKQIQEVYTTFSNMIEAERSKALKELSEKRSVKQEERDATLRAQERGEKETELAQLKGQQFKTWEDVEKMKQLQRDIDKDIADEKARAEDKAFDEEEKRINDHYDNMQQSASKMLYDLSAEWDNAVDNIINTNGNAAAIAAAAWDNFGKHVTEVFNQVGQLSGAFSPMPGAPSVAAPTIESASQYWVPKTVQNVKWMLPTSKANYAALKAQIEKGTGYKLYVDNLFRLFTTATPDSADILTAAAKALGYKSYTSALPIQYFQHGGFPMWTGLHHLELGEAVVPANIVRHVGASRIRNLIKYGALGNGSPSTINFRIEVVDQYGNLNEEKVVAIITPHLARTKNEIQRELLKQYTDEVHY